MSKKVSAWSFADGGGVGVSNNCSREDAFEEMRRYYVEDEGDEETAARIRIEDVKKSRIFRHKGCSVGTIGDPDACYDCGEPHLSNGRPIWVWQVPEAV
jgi:hypothetical protein